uniref:Uncharacterized protein n=1 Tax=Prymnesium polylepis TaxID=72548 RepID=A0A6T8DIH2_9EUKA
MQISVPSSSPKLQPFGPSPESPVSPRLQWLERHHWSHASDLRKLMQASDSDSESDSRERKRQKKSDTTSEGKRRKHTSEYKEKRRRKEKKRHKEPEHTKPQSTQGPSPKSIIPLLSLSVKTPSPSSPHGPLVPTWGDGERLKPGLNLSPRKRLSPVGPSATVPNGPAMPPIFHLDAGYGRV